MGKFTSKNINSIKTNILYFINSSGYCCAAIQITQQLCITYAGLPAPGSSFSN